LDSSRASEDAERARFASFPGNLQERGAGSERSFATLGQNERPCENQDKTTAKFLTYSRQWFAGEHIYDALGADGCVQDYAPGKLFNYLANNLRFSAQRVSS